MNASIACRAPGHARSGRPASPQRPRVRALGERGSTAELDSRLVKTLGRQTIQGCNAQTAVNEHQILVAAEVTVDSPDFGHLEPMVDATQRELERAGGGVARGGMRSATVAERSRATDRGAPFPIEAAG
jgi:hypothetical protein